MKKITLKQVNKIIAALGGKTEIVIKGLVDRISEEQPALFEYLRKADSRFNKKESELLITTAVMGWHIVKEELGCSAEIYEAFIERYYLANLALFDPKLVQDARRKENSPPEILSKFNKQPELMEFLARLIFDHCKFSYGPLRIKNLFPMLMNLKTFMDCIVLFQTE